MTEIILIAADYQRRLMSSYIRRNELSEDTQITDEIVKEDMSDTADTVEAYG